MLSCRGLPLWVLSVLCTLVFIYAGLDYMPNLSYLYLHHNGMEWLRFVPRG